MPTSKTPTHEQVEGRNPVLETLKGPRRVHEVCVSSGIERKGVIAEIIELCEEEEVPVREISRERFEEMAETTAPQGVVARVSPYRYAGLREIASAGDEHVPLVLVLDGVEDPRNFGSLLRVADAAGADGVVIPKHRSASVTPTVAKASAGAVEHVLVARVANIPSALVRLKEDGFWVIGAESKGGVPYHELDLTMPLAIVLGGEGRGLGRLVKERCDHLARIPMLGKVSSLNVANAGAVLLYEAVRQRSGKGQVR